MGNTNTQLTPSAVRLVSEEELAKWLRERGRRIVQSDGRYWIDYWGFCRLLHFAATIPAERIRRPATDCWAFHVLLPKEDAEAANAWSPLHLVENLSGYGEWNLDDTRRKQLRQCRKTFELVRLTDAGMLAEQGWPIYSANARRLGVPAAISRREYVLRAESWVADTGRLIIGALDGERLVAYLESFAVAGTAYLDEIYLSAQALSANVSAYLHFEAAQLYRDSGVVQQLCAGPPLPERMGVSEFKRRIGIPIVELPARFWSPRPLSRLLRIVRPGAHYRATGIPPRNMNAPGQRQDRQREEV